MDTSAEQILQKISFIEKDIELHKSILLSIPKGKEDEMEEVVRTIAELKTRADALKRSIAEVDPEVYQRVVKLEQSSEEFRKLTENKNLTTVISLDHHKECLLKLKDGTRLECLVKALADDGIWTVLTIDGDTRQFDAKEVIE